MGAKAVGAIIIFLEADLSAAESRVVRMLSRDPKMRELARVRPDEIDVHRWNASQVFGVPESAVTKDQRFFAKIVEHGAQRDMAGQTMSDGLLKMGIVRTADECQRDIKAYHARNPAIREHYFADVRKQVFRNRALANTWGRVITFDDLRLDDALYRQAYSFLPQSEVADILNQWGFVPLWRWMEQNRGKDTHLRINAQIHDALLMSVQPEDVYEVAAFLQQQLERPRLYLGEPMTIWCEFGIGSTWRKSHEWKRLPSRDEMTAAAMECERETE